MVISLLRHSKRGIVTTFLLTSVLVPALALAATTGTPTASPDSYNGVAADRAKKVVSALGLTDVSAIEGTTSLVTDHYLTLHRIDDARDKRIKSIRENASEDKAAKAADIAKAQDDAKLNRYVWHFEFVARLSTLLAPEDVEKVKDGLTYGVVPLTYGGYLKLYPKLSPEQQRQILAWLREAREHAMDGGSSEEKHGWFGKYKGRINNYLSSAGFDAKRAEAGLNAREMGKARIDSSGETSKR